MKTFRQFWDHISSIGVDGSLEKHLRRKVILSNQLSFTVTAFVALAWVGMATIFHANWGLLITILIACTSYALIMFFNSKRWFSFSRIWFNLSPLVILLYISGIISDGQVVSMKIALLSVIIVPITLFGIEERGKMIMGIVLVIATYIGMDFVAPLIPNLLVIDQSVVDSPVAIAINGLLSFGLLILAFAYFQTLANDAEQELANEKERSELLLLNILPEEIVSTLKGNPDTIANHYDDASVLFADIVNFTPISAQMKPADVVKLLNEVFSYFDSLAEKYNVEKIKTIGDCYMAASGVPRPRADHAQALVRMALEAQDHFQANEFYGYKISFRIGINSGPLIAGVIGRKKFIYDLWGDSVNTASRMESQGTGDRIQITRDTYELIKNDFICEPRGTVSVKGKGEMEIWHVIGAQA